MVANSEDMVLEQRWSREVWRGRVGRVKSGEGGDCWKQELAIAQKKLSEEIGGGKRRGVREWGGEGLTADIRGTEK